jgi:DNA-binding transcriptional ArsR family regulator
VELLGRYSNRTKWAKTVHRALDSQRSVTKPHTERRTVRRLRAEQVAALVVEYEAGATVYELAERFKVHRQTVSEHLHRQGVKMRRQGLNGPQIDEAAQLYGRGWPLARIARTYEVNPSTVWLALRGLGVRMRDAHGK